MGRKIASKEAVRVLEIIGRPDSASLVLRSPVKRPDEHGVSRAKGEDLGERAGRTTDLRFGSPSWA
jgi:hypothetical protein